jgi:hypothetical protein
MTEGEKIHAAYLDANRVRNDPALGYAMISLRKDALEELAKVPATDTDKIRDLQAQVRAIDGLATEIANAILRWEAMTPDQRAAITG